jgi:serine/threonine protein kinase
LTPERWAQVEELFHRAAECEPEHRTALLAEVCSDDAELRREVEALLSCQESAGDHLRDAVNVGLGAVGFPLVGETVSHYRILDGLGEGGMGLVYRAEDVKLGRQVALKFLAEYSAKNPAALGRFEREARSASALEHPNICPIYEFGEHEGRPFLVMQLLEGQTLRELIAAASSGKAPLGFLKLLDLAIQTVDGLSAAHQKGIIHRDIKPANIFVTSQGQAKILDFGLAKLAPAVTVIGEDAESDHHDGETHKTSGESSPMATPDPFLSRTGVAMGTAGYMSPEQARGEKLDARTDLFSFGLVLYEMATGQRAFKGDTGPVLHEAILKQLPAPPRRLNPSLPIKLEKIIHGALEKDRVARYQSAVELRTDLESLKQDLLREPHPLRTWGSAAGFLALILIFTIVWIKKRPPSTLPDLKLRQLTTNSPENRVNGGKISPDGKYLGYCDMNGLYVKLIETGETRAVPKPEEFKDQNVAWDITLWFPDSTGFVANAHRSGADPNLWNSQESSIWMASMLGGAPRKLRDNAFAWSVSRDGSLIAFGTNKGRLGEREIWLMASSGDQARRLFDTDEESAIGALSWSPDGKRALYVKTDRSGDTFLSRDLTSGPPTILFGPTEMKNVNDLLWLADGRLLYSLSEPKSSIGTACNFWEMRLDGHTGTPIGKPRKLTNWSGFCMGDLSETSDGKKLAFRKWAPKLTSFLADLAAGGTRILRPRHFPLSESSEGPAGWTPDSKAIILTSDRPGPFGIYRQSLDQDIAEPIVTEGYSRNTWVAPDGKSIVYLGIGVNGLWPARGPEPVMRVSITGGPSQQVFTANPWSLLRCARFPSGLCVIGEPTEDGKQLIVTAFDPLKGRGPELFRFALVANDDNWCIDLSPDGTRVAVTRTQAGPFYILSLGGRVLRQFKVRGWSNLLAFTWAADGKGLFVTAAIRNGRKLLHVDLQGNAHVLWEDIGGSNPTQAFPSPDGRYLAFAGWPTNANMWLMENF